MIFRISNSKQKQSKHTALGSNLLPFSIFHQFFSSPHSKTSHLFLTLNVLKFRSWSLLFFSPKFRPWKFLSATNTSYLIPGRQMWDWDGWMDGCWLHDWKRELAFTDGAQIVNLFLWCVAFFLGREAFLWCGVVALFIGMGWVLCEEFDVRDLMFGIRCSGFDVRNPRGCNTFVHYPSYFASHSSTL